MGSRHDIGDEDWAGMEPLLPGRRCCPAAAAATAA